MGKDREKEASEGPDRTTFRDAEESRPTSSGDFDSVSPSESMENTLAYASDQASAEAGARVRPESGKTVRDRTDGAPTKLGRFKINGILGAGGFGTVYLGFDDRLKRSVAIKVPNQVLTGVELEKFIEEAQRLAQLRHPGIVTVFDVSEFDGRCYIVSDYLKGQTLSDWMDSNAFDWRQAALITAKLADALAHAHSQGTVHRDIKPKNVMMLSDDQPVLIDFGLAVSDTYGERESPGTVAGTVCYMSPEQAMGKAHRIDGRTDIYGLGVVLYRLLCRKRPFSSNKRAELERQIREDEPQPLRQIVPEIPLALEEVCLKAMSKRMADRFTTASDFASALREVVEQENGGRQSGSNLDARPIPNDANSRVSDAGQKSSRRMHEAERRQITTLNLDLDDSDIDVEDLDPEELRSVVQRIRQLTDSVLTQFGGHFARSSSESIQVYFGYPQAQEDSAQQAVLAAFEIRSKINELHDRLRKVQGLILDFRIGIHTGIVVTEEVVSEVSSERHSIVGNVPRVATGLAALGNPGDIVVSDATRQIVGDAFRYESIGVHSGKTIGRNVEVFLVIEANEEAFDAHDAADAQQTPLIGREHEMGLFRERWEQARNGAGQVMLVCAEAGVGKTRLLTAFRQSSWDASQQPFQARCSTYYQNSAFHPISELLIHLAQFGPEDSDETKLAKLEALLERYDVPLEPVVPLFVDLVSIPLGPHYPVFEGTPERRKQKTIEALVELMFAASELQPLLFTIEDLHWIDPTSLEFLTVLIEQIPSAPILLVATYRPEFSSPWQMHAGLNQLMIGNLTPQQTTEVITRIAGERTLPEEVVAHIVDKTGGVPLFTEELTKLILKSDLLERSGDEYVLARPLESVTIPSTIQDSLMARLDLLGQAKDVAQLASVVGRSFTFQLLAEIAPLDEKTLQEELTTLVDAELVQQRGFFPRTRYRFKHALVQDTAYGSLLRSTRSQWHGRIAEVMVTKFPKTIESDPALLAHHYTEAGEAIPAIGYWEKAGLQAQEKSANQEAISHFYRGLTLVETLDEGQERDGLEFKFQIPLGVALLTTQGYAAPGVGPVFERAQELGQKVAGPAEQFFIHWGIWAWRVVREELQLCRQLAEEGRGIVDPLGDDGLKMEASFMMALTSFYQADFGTSLVACEKGFELYDEEKAKLYARHTGQNVGVTMQCYWALALWHLGYPDQARARIENAIAMGRDVKHPISLAYALGHSGWLHHTCRMSSETMAAAEETIGIGTDQGFPFWLAEGLIHKGFSLLLDGKTEECLQTMQAGLDVFNMTGAKLSLCHFNAMIAQAHLQGGKVTEALQQIDEAIESSAENGNAFFLPEIHRIRGEIMLADNQLDEALSCFEQSLEIARTQSAKSWELRTAMSLCRLQQQQGRGKDARESLQAIFDWFTEGFETPDLVEAREMLATLK